MSITTSYFCLKNISLQASDHLNIYLHLPILLPKLQVVPYTKMSSMGQTNRASCPVSCLWHWSVVSACDRVQQGKHTVISLVHPPHFQQSAAQRHLQWQAVSKKQRHVFFLSMHVPNWLWTHIHLWHLINSTHKIEIEL